MASGASVMIGLPLASGQTMRAGIPLASGRMVQTVSDGGERQENEARMVDGERKNQVASG